MEKKENLSYPLQSLQTFDLRDVLNSPLYDHDRVHTHNDYIIKYNVSAVTIPNTSFLFLVYTAFIASSLFNIQIPCKDVQTILHKASLYEDLFKKASVSWLEKMK